MKERIEKVRSSFKSKEIEGIVVYKPENRRYLSGFTGTTGYVIITEEKNIFATDFRYTEQASSQCSSYEIKEIDNKYTIYDIINELGINKLGIEDAFITYKFANKIKQKVKNIELIPLEGLIINQRMIKDESELKLIEKAAQITDDAFDYIINDIKVGMTEEEVAIKIEYFMREKGAEGRSFDFIVASGKRSSMPHGVASDKVIEDGDFVTIDMGCKYKGYCSDFTRTFIMGKANKRQKEIYDIVLEAEKKVIQNIKPGVTGYELDKIARDIISQKGYGDNFGHGLGHGVGLEIHELPRLSFHKSSKDIKLQEGMVITDEPGIYINNFGGVRIEDLIVVTKDGCKVLSKSTKELIEVNN